MLGNLPFQHFLNHLGFIKELGLAQSFFNFNGFEAVEKMKMKAGFDLWKYCEIQLKLKCQNKNSYTWSII